MNLPSAVRIVEVGPRDGLQNEPGSVPTETKIEFIRRLAAAGLTSIEIGSFVSPKWVPQMADSAAVAAAVEARRHASYSALVPNLKGLEQAIAAGLREVAVFTAASETFSQRNTNCSIAESIERFRPVVARARAEGIRVRGYISCVLGCPYEGTVAPERVAALAATLHDMGCDEISLGDTIGVGTARQAQALVAAVAQRVPITALAVHFHDTYGQALPNILACMELGITVVDASTAGLGGCPYAPGASGNVATEDVLYMLDGLGVHTGVDLDGVVRAALFISRVLGRPPAGRVSRARAAKIEDT